MQIPKKFPQAPFKKLNILRLVIYMVHPHPGCGKSGCRLSNYSTVIFLPDVCAVWRWPNPIKTLNVPFLLQVRSGTKEWKEKNTKTNNITIAKNQKLATQNSLFNIHIHFPLVTYKEWSLWEFFGNLHWSLEKKKTKLNIMQQ
jgi:hypothetical protein